ncbi:MAG: LuxR C-terminal-related transcriptional regulator [Desulfococcaceae bacterium]
MAKDKKLTKNIPFSEVLARSILDSLSAHVAILDKNGLILETNAAWKRFAHTNDIRMRPDTIHVNYLEVCNSSFGESSEEAGTVYRGIRDLIEEKIDEFVIEYPCHSPDENRWFYMRATRLVLEDEMLIVVSHENITPLKLAEERLKNRERELEMQTANLKDVNTALKVLLNQREKDKAELEERVVSNIREQVFPYLDKLAASHLDERQCAWTEIVRSYLKDVTSPFFKRFASLQLQLTPQEIRIASLIKEGRNTKEIADILGCSGDAVEFHRKNIRRKLGLTRKKTNLQTYLLSLT